MCRHRLRLRMVRGMRQKPYLRCCSECWSLSRSSSTSFLIVAPALMQGTSSERPPPVRSNIFIELAFPNRARFETAHRADLERRVIDSGSESVSPQEWEQYGAGSSCFLKCLENSRCSLCLLGRFSLRSGTRFPLLSDHGDLTCVSALDPGRESRGDGRVVPPSFVFRCRVSL